MRWRWACRDYIRWIEMWGRTRDTWWSEGACGSSYRYKKGGNMGYFGNPIVISGFVLCNILYCIVESFFLIRGRRHDWPNHVKTSCTVCVIILSLCSWTNIVGIKAFVVIITGIRAWVEDFWKGKRSQSTQDENKRNFHWRWSWLLFRGDMIQKGLCHGELED